jgi:hypothetical protein
MPISKTSWVDHRTVAISHRPATAQSALARDRAGASHPSGKRRRIRGHRVGPPLAGRARHVRAPPRAPTSRARAAKSVSKLAKLHVFRAPSCAGSPPRCRSGCNGIQRLSRRVCTLKCIHDGKFRHQCVDTLAAPVVRWSPSQTCAGLVRGTAARHPRKGS